MVDPKNQLAIFDEVVNPETTTNVVMVDEFPTINSPVFQSPNGTSYLQAPGVAMLSKPQANIDTMLDFLSGFCAELNFLDYLDDPAPLQDSDRLCKTSGQLCYNSFGSNRTYNKDAGKYFKHIRESEHGSVLEHANYSFLLYGVSRSCTMELIRHRILSFSQVSQRYCDGKTLRFVERPEYVKNDILHRMFIDRIDITAYEYEELTKHIMKDRQNTDIFPKLSKTDLRKSVQQTSRSLLTNEVEAPIVVTGNARAWLEFLGKRASVSAEPEICRVAVYIYRCLNTVSDHLFNHLKEQKLLDGRIVLE